MIPPSTSRLSANSRSFLLDSTLRATDFPELPLRIFRFAEASVLHVHTFCADTSATLPKVRRVPIERTIYLLANISRMLNVPLCPPNSFDVVDQKNP